MGTLYLLQCGETKGERDKVLQGSTISYLTDNGYDQAHYFKDALSGIDIKTIFFASTTSCRDTANIIAEGRKIKLIPENSIMSIYFGRYENKKNVTTNELAHIFSYEENDNFGESFSDFVNRIRNTLLKYQGEDKIVIVANSYAFIVLKALLRKDEVPISSDFVMKLIDTTGRDAVLSFNI